MEVLPQLLPIEKNVEEIRNEIITNVLKMLKERKLIDDIEDIKKKLPEGSIISIPTKTGMYYIKMYRSPVISLGKVPEITDFLNSTTEHKILIVQSMNTRTEQKVILEYPGTEVFLEKNLMMNLSEHVLIPKHELLSDEEAEKVINEYDLKKKEFPKILWNDPMARYYNMQVGQICRIIRPSETAGLGFTYRLVIKPVYNKPK